MSTITFDFRHHYQRGERRESEQIAYQWDLGHVMEVFVPEDATYTVGYCFGDYEKTEDYAIDTKVPDPDGGYKLTAHIPNKYFERSGELRVYVVGSADDHIITTYEGFIPIRGRLQPDDYVDDDPENGATQIIEVAREYATKSESFAVGGTGTREGEDTDNAKYYLEQAEEVAESIPEDYSELSDDVDQLKNALDQVEGSVYKEVTDNLTHDFQVKLEQNKGYYINLNLEYGTVITYEATAATAVTSYAVYPCSKGDAFAITGKGGNNSRLWGFVDEDDKLKLRSAANINTGDTPVIATAPVDGHIIINVTSLTIPTPTLSHTYTADVVPELENLTGIHSKFYHGELSSLPVNLRERYRPILDTSLLTNLDEHTTYSEIISVFDSLMTDANGYITKEDLGAASGLINGSAPHVYKYTFKPAIATTPITPQIMPVILIDGSMHGFEKNSTYAWYCFLYDLVHNFGQNPTLAYIRGNVEIQIIPVLNPYGFENKEYTNGNGVNINRNFDTPDWVYVESGNNASGDAPMDQPETQMVAKVIADNPTALMYINTHTNGRYYASGYPQANSNLMSYIPDDYYQNRLMTVIQKCVQSQTVILPTEYEELTPTFGQTIGRCDQSTLITDPTTHPGVFEKYVVIRTTTMGFSLEVFNGLSVDGTPVLPIFDADAKAVAAEIVGNMLIEIIREYSN